ncbi:hypothetical protein [Elizabethkingia ursingii]|jgi:hypothetical protein|uniref:Uncharacterized protein n=1 Tax=Elizabethkingia ursingii TaxID=1756150 RepID=A0AAJ3NGM6_9FLAO|nr:hypothetical protein [Elizabethkingia ursingii]AQX10573.1 hypothetical protein BBD34_18920 [Elizabethkingia ursingii]OPB80520.1 hypothetical protein BAY32_15995 [Elizabethkingia ursingii]
MNTYHFHFNNGKKTSTILFWFFATLLTVSLTGATIVLLPNPLFPAWLLLISFPLMLIAIYRLFKVAANRRSIDIISLSQKGFISSCFGEVLFSEIQSIQVPVREIGLLDGLQWDYYKKTDADPPNLKFSIITRDGKVLTFIMNEWGGLYNSKEDFSVFFNFITVLADHLYQLYYPNESYKSYLKILDEEGFWRMPG